MGVEFDYKTRRPVAYYLFDKNPHEHYFVGGRNSSKSKRTSAENILHIFMPERPNQSRGYSPISSCLKELKMLHAYAEAELVASRVNASAMGFITTPSGDGYVGEDTAGDNFNPMMNVEAGTIQQLPSGSDFKKFDTSHPTTAFDPFIKSILRQISAGLNVSYNDLSMDYSSVNYSSLRQASLNDRDYYKTVQQFVINHFCKPVYESWLKMYLTSSDEQLSPLPMSKYNKFNDTVFIPRAFDWIDPLKEMNANVVGLKAGVVSLQDVVSKTGRDVEEHFEQLQKEKKLAEDFNINFAYEPFGDKGAVAPQEEIKEDEKTKKNNKEDN
jgi:lambda family phage portal protein